jgi:hypothetical protein
MKNDAFRQAWVLNVEAAHSFETTASVLQITWRHIRDNRNVVGLEVLTLVVMGSPIFWDMAPRRPFKVNRSFELTYCLHLQGRKISQIGNQHEAGRGRSERRLTFNGLHAVIGHFERDISFSTSLTEVRRVVTSMKFCSALFCYLLFLWCCLFVRLLLPRYFYFFVGQFLT